MRRVRSALIRMQVRVKLEHDMTLRRTLRWRPLEGAGLEHCDIEDRGSAIHVRSTLIGERDGTDFGVTYEMELARDWTFRAVVIRRTDKAAFTLVSDGKGNWKDGESRALAELAGCIDVDISGTPFTNTLPMRRAKFEPGVPQRFDMAWIPLDTLKPFKDGQIYTWLGGDRWRYQAADGSFEAELTVDADRFVVHYPQLFERV